MKKRRARLREEKALRGKCFATQQASLAPKKSRSEVKDEILSKTSLEPKQQAMYVANLVELARQDATIRALQSQRTLDEVKKFFGCDT